MDGSTNTLPSNAVKTAQSRNGGVRIHRPRRSKRWRHMGAVASYGNSESKGDEETGSVQGGMDSCSKAQRPTRRQLMPWEYPRAGSKNCGPDTRAKAPIGCSVQHPSSQTASRRRQGMASGIRCPWEDSARIRPDAFTGTLARFRHRPGCCIHERIIESETGAHIPHSAMHGILKDSDMAAAHPKKERVPQVDQVRVRPFQFRVAYGLCDLVTEDGSWDARMMHRVS